MSWNGARFITDYALQLPPIKQEEGMYFFTWPVLALSLGAFSGISTRTASIIAAIFIGVPALIAVWVLIKQLITNYALRFTSVLRRLSEVQPRWRRIVPAHALAQLIINRQVLRCGYALFVHLKPEIAEGDFALANVRY
jgi:hypothetical protein